MCLKVVDTRVTSLPADKQAEFAKNLAALLEKRARRARRRLVSYGAAGASHLVWCTVEKSDVAALVPWIEWAFAHLHQQARSLEKGASCHAQGSHRR